MADRRSALAGVYFTGRFGRLDRGGPSLILRERLGLKLVELSAWGDTGLNLPPPGRAAGLESGVALWIGPDRWWLVDAPDWRAENAAAVDQSHGQVCLRLAGGAVREMLAKGCPLDLDRLTEGTCAGTRLGPFRVLLHAVDAATIDLYVARSYAHACWEWLTDAAGEFGYEVPAAG